MKKIQFLTILSGLLMRTDLQAQDPGVGAAQAAQTSIGNSWQNWAFAGSALLTATAALVVISLGSGESSSAH